MFKQLAETSQAKMTFHNFAVLRSGGYSDEKFEKKLLNITDLRQANKSSQFLEILRVTWANIILISLHYYYFYCYYLILTLILHVIISSL